MDKIPRERKAIATRLRAAREQAGLSQGQVAKLLNVKRPTVSEMEAGRRRVSAEELSQLAQIYDVSASWLVKNQPEITDPRIDLAARELAKLKQEDLDTVIGFLQTLRRKEGDQS